MMKTLFVSSLPENEGHSEQFLQDVLRLLSVHTAKSALELRFRADPASGSTFMADLPSAGLPLVSRFFGAHRAQIVPNDSPTGRIITVRVMVACIDHGASSRSPDEATGAAFTYSYPLGVVTAHGAGRQYPLGEFLEGRVG